MEQDSKPPPRPHPRQPAKPRTRPSKKPGPDSESKSAKTKRRRDLQRLLERSTRLPADVRIEHERELASLSHDLQRTRRQEKGYKIARRYKMVRLFGGLLEDIPSPQEFGQNLTDQGRGQREKELLDS